jgi:hypothetical protein
VQGAGYAFIPDGFRPLDVRGRAGRRGSGNGLTLLTPPAGPACPVPCGSGAGRRGCKSNATPKRCEGPPVARHPARGVYRLAPCDPRWTDRFRRHPFRVRRLSTAGWTFPCAAAWPRWCDCTRGARIAIGPQVKRRQGAPGPHGLGRRSGRCVSSPSRPPHRPRRSSTRRNPESLSA